MYNAETSAAVWVAYQNALTVVTNNTTLSNDQKILVTANIESVNNYFEQLLEGGYELIINGIGNEIGESSPNGRTSADPCVIRTRDALRTGVEGAVAGAVAGGIAGATVGSAVFPVLGTATGAVNCAVFGFATGFTTGVVGSVVKQWFWNCLLKSPHTGPTVDCNPETDADYCLVNEPDQRALWFKRMVLGE